MDALFVKIDTKNRGTCRTTVIGIFRRKIFTVLILILLDEKNFLW